ncbi:LamG domain-containing protein [Asticcacaulis sp. EMRT-3]|uniref:LamG domain-containing protein n=1 Tax=Asticcacaulis sp. EMRT-3 TaxID=3040349 RepID=UPI0024AF8B88|nr:LamG domain-containing protein [Asticcacaulis sp. EMRT-3]MDI7776401.1 LamG domain-containing protein [Asticcacaulis sp. EMRT-3]
MRFPHRLLLTAALSALASAAHAQTPDGLLFSLSGEHGLTAETAGGQAGPIFATRTHETDGVVGKGLGFDPGLSLAWSAPGNIYARRGTISFFFRPKTPLGHTPFPIFRVAKSDGTSWDMLFLRIDWNGHGFDAFVTDTGLARTRVSFRMDQIPSPDQWVHIAFAWDETQGVKLWVNGKPVASKVTKAVYDQGLWGFGPFQRTVSPWQVHSLYNYKRTGDLDELRIYDHMMSDAEVAALDAHQEPQGPAVRESLSDPATRDDWNLRYGWNRPDDLPALLTDPVTTIRKVEFTGTWDLHEKNFKGADGIRETTWPGVYNRSRLPGRHDYFELPDWNVYSGGGKTYRLTLPDEPWNRIEINGTAYGELKRTAGDGAGQVLFTRPEGQERTSNALPTMKGGEISFVNTAQETPIEEIGAYYVHPGAVPKDYVTLSYMLSPDADPAFYPALDNLRAHINGRYLPDERDMAVALPKGAPRKPEAPRPAGLLPIVHVLIPGDFRSPLPGDPPTRFSYGWENMNAGLDGVELDLPALKGSGNALIPLNIRLKDPTWPDRDLLDVNVSVKPGEARTLWLDTRDRLLPNGTNFYLTIAAGEGGFDAQSLDGMKVNLVFKKAAEAKPEHIADRLEQARDNLSFLVEEQPNIRLYPLWSRFENDITDVLRVDPDNALARAYWVEKNPEQPYADYTPAQAPAGVPLWAFRQSEDLKLFRQFADWWIDHRQMPDGDSKGEFGGGLSDDTDLVNQWVPLALMGVEPEKIIASQRAVADATFTNGMWSGGLSRIRADELHSYEEGINAVAQSMQIDWGNPTNIERGMAVAREYPRLMQVNPAGHMHFVSSYYSGTDIDRDDGMGVQKPDSLLVTHPGLLLVDYNGNPQTKARLLSLLDGWLAHGEKTAHGWSFPSDIDWQTDKGTGHGVGIAVHDFWAAYTWTGDDTYLRPMEGALKGNLSGLTELNADVLTQVPGEDQVAHKIADSAGQAGGGSIDRNLGGATPGQFARFVRWQETGDKSILADLYGDEIEATAQRMPVLTSLEAWVDRVSVSSDLLQRTRLGGVAHRRMAFYPGNIVSWRFTSGDHEVSGENVAILIPKGDPKAFKVIAYNLTDQPVTAHMTGAQLAGGVWSLTGPNGEKDVRLERGRTVDLALPPHQQVSFDLALKTPGDDPSTRPDIGIGASDISLKGRTLSLTVHSLGAKPTPAGTAIISDAAGHPLAQVAFPALAAPTDLLPKTATVRVSLPGTWPKIGGPVRIILHLTGAPDEVTDANNTVELPDL